MPPSHAQPLRPPDAESFHCDVSREGATATVHVRGELDLATVPVLDDQLAELRGAGFRHLILDLRGLYFIDSTGLRCILRYDAEPAKTASRSR